MWGRRKRCVNPFYTENAGSVEKSEEDRQKPSEITVHVYKNKISEKKITVCTVTYCIFPQ